MILACPVCRATFKIPDGAIPPGGRKVRCAKCKHSWHTDLETIARQQAQIAAAAAVVQPVRPVQRSAPPVQPAAPQQNFDGPLDDATVEATAALRQTVKGVVDIDDGPLASKDSDPLFEDDGSETGPPLAGDKEDDFGGGLKSHDEYAGAMGDLPDDDSLDDDLGDDDDFDADDFLTRRRADQRRQHERDSASRRDKLVMGGWIGLAIFWLITFYVLVVEKERMLSKFPGVQPLYSFMGSMDEKEMYRPEPGQKLTPSKAKAEVYISAKLDPSRTKIDLVNGEEKLVVQGYVENLGITGANVPKVLVRIVDEQGVSLDEWVVDPVGLIIRKEGRAPFTSVRDVPVGIANVEASVIEGSKSSTSGEYP